MLLTANAGVIDATWGAALDAWRRPARYVIQAFTSANTEPLPPVPKGKDLFRAMIQAQHSTAQHSTEIARVYGYRGLSEPETVAEFRSFLTARAWTRAERPTQLFDQRVAWLRAERVLLPGVSVLARLVAEVSGATGDRLYSVLAGRVSPDRGLDGLLSVPAGSLFQGLERRRQT